MKNTYVVKELNDINSEREGVRVEASSLSQAKRLASRDQFFIGTVLRIEDENGNRLAYKQGQRWEDL